LTIEERLRIVELQLEKALPLLKRIDESSVVTGFWQARHESIMNDHAEWLQAHDRALNAHTEWLQAHDRQMAEFKAQREKDAAEARERGEALDKRIGDLVSAIGKLIAAKK
jgi:hypothetical protein